jgi:DNA (cytosine-5)-methyltransferase 1
MPTAVSLFSGCGGFCEGVELAGFDVKVAVEMDRFACETYSHNFPRIPLFQGDIRDFLPGRGSEHRAKYHLNGVDLVFGGSPCQGYSQIGPRDLMDGRNKLYVQFARIVRLLRPRIFLMENVPNLLLMNKGHFRDAIIRYFATSGYKDTTVLRLSAADFGVPQTRERIFFVGTRDDITMPCELGAYTESILRRMKKPVPVTVREAIDDLPAEVVHSGHTMPYPAGKALSSFQREMRLDREGILYPRAFKRRRGFVPKDPAVLHNHHTKEIQERRKALIALLAPGAKADSLPKKVWNGARPAKWRRLHPDLPSYTILAQMHRDLSEWVHPSLERWITVREAARLQSFHDGFIFKSSEWQMLKQIGNAVPPLLAYAAARMALTVLEATEERSLQKRKFSRLPEQLSVFTAKGAREQSLERRHPYRSRPDKFRVRTLRGVRTHSRMR